MPCIAPMKDMWKGRDHVDLDLRRATHAIGTPAAVSKLNDVLRPPRAIENPKCGLSWGFCQAQTRCVACDMICNASQPASCSTRETTTTTSSNIQYPSQSSRMHLPSLDLSITTSFRAFSPIVSITPVRPQTSARAGYSILLAAVSAERTVPGSKVIVSLIQG